MIAVSAAPASAASSHGGENVTLYRATDTTFESAEDVEAAIENGTISPTHRMVVGETLVVGIDSGRLTRNLSAGNGSTTKRFFDALDGDAEFRIVQTNMNSHSPPKVALVGPANVTVYRQRATAYALVETGAVEFKEYYKEKSKYEPAEIRDGDAFAVEFGYDLGEIPFHGASAYDPAGPEVTLHTSESEMPGRITATEGLSETTTPSASSTETAATPTMPGSTGTTAPATTTDTAGPGLTPIAPLVALMLLSLVLIRATRRT